MKLNDTQKLNRFILKEKLLGVIYPRACPVCGKLIKVTREDLAALKYYSADPSFISGRQSADPFICPDCNLKLDRCTDRQRCMKCSKPVDGTEEYCRDCLTKERFFDMGFSPLIHNETARDIMYDLKYRNMRCNADVAAFEMVNGLISSGSGINSSPFLDVDAVIPVPLHKKRLRERGYNQAAQVAERLALFAEIAGHEPLHVDEDYLIRDRMSERLKEMSGPERAAELSGAFSVNKEAVTYRKVLLVDDIFTSGATLNECAKTLRHAGASVIYFMTATIGSQN